MDTVLSVIGNKQNHPLLSRAVSYLLLYLNTFTIFFFFLVVHERFLIFWKYTMIIMLMYMSVYLYIMSVDHQTPFENKSVIETLLADGPYSLDSFLS